jgi:hypothetical protein
MKSFLTMADTKEILERLRQVRPDSPRQWGRMSSHQMLCHLNDSFKFTLGEKENSSVSNPFTRTVVKWIALYTPMKWPQGSKTMPEMDQLIGGTPPVEFEGDRTLLLTLIERFTGQANGNAFPPHPFFGQMNEFEWMRWGYLHCDHHLRQFGV